MSLAAFQQALCELIASPPLCLAVRSDPSEFFSRHELSERERKRLFAIVWQPGMSTNCTLYRSNRVTPIYTLLHLTCVLLVDRLKDELEQYWATTDLRDLEFRPETERFAAHLRRRMTDGAIKDPFLAEILDLEIAANELRYAPRQRVLDELRQDGESREGPDLAPLMRVVRFSHDPDVLLRCLASGRRPEAVPLRECFVRLSMADGNLQTVELELEEGRALWGIQGDRPGASQRCDDRRDGW